MPRPRVQEVRRSQKKSLYLHELSRFVQQIAYDEPAVARLFMTRVELSRDGGMCYVYFSAYGAQDEASRRAAFEEARPVLVLYKPSLRKAFGDMLQGRYVPDLRFVFDAQKEKEMRINDLLQKVSDELAALSPQEKADEEE